MFTVDDILHQYYPKFSDRPLITPPLRILLRRLLREQEFVRFAQEYPHLQGMDFVEQVLETLQVTYALNDRERGKHPRQWPGYDCGQSSHWQSGRPGAPEADTRGTLGCAYSW